MQQRALLLDRDGVINEDYNYVYQVEKFDYKPGIFPFLRRAQTLGYRLAVVTNQSGVARQYYSVGDYKKLTEAMIGDLKAEGIHLDLVLACFVHTSGVEPGLVRESFFRKPNPGMILEAALKMNLDLSRSVLIGDKKTDIEAGQRAGVGRLILFGDREGPLPGVEQVAAFEAIEL